MIEHWPHYDEAIGIIPLGCVQHYSLSIYGHSDVVYDLFIETRILQFIVLVSNFLNVFRFQVSLDQGHLISYLKYKNFVH